MFHVIEQYREKNHPMLGSDHTYGNNGIFIIPHERIKNYEYRLQVSDGEGWEHVSVNVAERRKKASRCPTWGEMSKVKSMLWDKDDCVVQFHPRESEYVNLHPFCLHLWRPTNHNIPTPPKEFVGY
jgi:hypothetical protein